MFESKAPHGFNRRSWLEHSALLAAGAALSATGAPATAADRDALLPIVDTHQHLWDLSRFKLAWLADAPMLDKSYLPQDYAQAADGLKIVKSVYMEVDIVPEQQDAEVDYVSKLCEEGTGRPAAAIVSGRPAAESFPAYLARHGKNPWIRGLRQVLHGQAPPGFCRSTEFVRGVRQMGEAGWSFELCLRPEELSDGAYLVQQCPDTQFVLDHCGNASVLTPPADAWKRGVGELAQEANVFGKISGIIASGTEGRWSLENLAPIVDHTFDAFGPERVMFGGDWPVCTLGATLREWVTALKQIVGNRPQADQRRLFHDNAVQFYRLG